MTMQCPHCNSTRLKTLDRAKQAGGALGFVGGAASGAAGAMSGARMGATVGLVGGPVGVAIGGIAGAIFGGLMGGAAGGITGTQVGKIIDERLLKNFQCLECAHTFDANGAKYMLSK